jgi:hypothetical protein
MRHKLEHLQNALDEAADIGARPLRDGRTSERLLPFLAENLACEWGTLWKVDAASHQLCPVATWKSQSTGALRLERDTIGRSLSLSEGNAGHVWRSRKPIWTVDLIKDMCIPRSLDAADAGLRGGIWFAVKTEDAVYGVVELLGRNVPPPTTELLAQIEILGIRLGTDFEAASRK